MVDLKSRTQKPVMVKIDFGSGEEEFLFPKLDLVEQVTISELSDAEKGIFLLKKYAKIIDPKLSDDDIMKLDESVVKLIFDAILQLKPDE